jgi:hypothetical protein
VLAFYSGLLSGIIVISVDIDYRVRFNYYNSIGFLIKKKEGQMKLQKNLLWIPVVFTMVWGLFGLFAPETLMRFLDTPAESINLALVSTQMVLGVSQISLGIIALWMRSLKDKNAMSGAMTVVAVVFLFFGLEAVLVDYVVEGLASNTILFIQGVVFIVLAILFFINRKPKIDMQ